MTREKDRSVAHIEAKFLIGADGRELHEYDGELVRPAKIVNDANKSLGNG